MLGRFWCWADPTHNTPPTLNAVDISISPIMPPGTVQHLPTKTAPTPCPNTPPTLNAECIPIMPPSAVDPQTRPPQKQAQTLIIILTPKEFDAVCFKTLPTLNAERISINPVMSTSLKVVSMAYVFCAPLRRSATRRRRRVIFTRLQRAAQHTAEAVVARPGRSTPRHTTTFKQGRAAGKAASTNVFQGHRGCMCNRPA